MENSIQQPENILVQDNEREEPDFQIQQDTNAMAYR